jgi:cell division protein FtsL
MLKLLICLVSSMAVAVCLVQLRQQHLELNHQTSQLHNQIESRQARLWNQQLQIASITAPPALQASLAKQDLKLTNLAPIETAPVSWIDSPMHN